MSMLNVSTSSSLLDALRVGARVSACVGNNRALAPEWTSQRALPYWPSTEFRPFAFVPNRCADRLL